MSSFNYAAEKIRFEKTWEKNRAIYEKAGMAPSAIEEMRSFDWECFKKERNWRLHESLLSEILPPDEDERDAIALCEGMIVQDQYSEITDKASLKWLNSISDPVLLSLLMQLSEIDLTILSLSEIMGYDQAEIGIRLGMSQPAVSKRLKKTKKYLADGYKNAIPSA